MEVPVTLKVLSLLNLILLITKGLGDSALTTAIGGPVTSLLTSLFNGNQDNKVEPTEEIIVEDGFIDKRGWVDPVKGKEFYNKRR
jgi:hypothetical protein